MNSLQELLSSKPKQKVERSQRAELIKLIYSLYCSPVQNKLRKIENWKRYIVYCKSNGLGIKETKNVEKFKKNKLFIKLLPIKAFCFRISHIKTADLFYVLSESKDRNNRGQSIAKFLL